MRPAHGLARAAAPRSARTGAPLALLLALTSALAAAGCDGGPGAPPAPGARARPVRIVALGDSTTEAGWEGNAKSVYAERLAEALAARGIAVEMFNAGLSDTTSLQALTRLDADVRRHAPDYVVVQFGINDSWIDASLGRSAPRLSLGQYDACLRAIVRALRADGALPILMTPNPMRWSELYGAELRDPALGFDLDDPRGMNRLLERYAARVREIARQEEVPLLDVFARFEAYGEAPGQRVEDLLIEGDGIHPNDAGHALIAEWLLELLLPRLAAGPLPAAAE